MTRKQSVHLTDEALNDLLIGLGTLESQSHLVRCPECRGKVEQFSSDVDHFNRASMAWSETQLLRPARIAGRRPVFRMPVALAGLFAVAILSLAVVVPMWRYEISKTAASRQTNVAQASDSEEQIAADNKLMQDVNVAISPREESPIDEYGLSESPRAQFRAQSK